MTYYRPHEDIIVPLPYIDGLGNKEDYRTWQIGCPACPNEGVEQGDGRTAEHEAVTLQPDRDEYVSPIGTRGGYTEIQLWCPSGHKFRLIVANHKGAQVLGIIQGW